MPKAPRAPAGSARTADVDGDGPLRRHELAPDCFQEPDAPLPGPPGSSPAAAATTRADELVRFNRLAATWWDARGPMRPLHVLNALRAGRVQTLAETHFGRAPGSGLHGLRVLDLGCGAGLMCEALARAGAQVTGIDAAERSIAIARQHAATGGWVVDYRCGEPASTLAAGERFDAVLLLEVVEHVQAVPPFVASALAHLAPGGLVIASTLNRSWRSFVFAIVGAEWLFRLLPLGTHRWRQFVTPAELAAAMAGAGLRQQSLTGLRYLPLLHRARWCRSTAVNYLASYAATPSRPVPEPARGPLASGPGAA